MRLFGRKSSSSPSLENMRYPLENIYLVGPAGVQPLKSSRLFREFMGIADASELDVSDLWHSVIKAYRASVWVYRCVRIRSQAVAAIPLRVVDAITGEDLPEHPMAAVFSPRNSSLLYKTESDLQIFGEAFWSFGYDGKDLQVKRLNPSTIETIATEQGILGYRQIISGRIVHEWDAHEIVHFFDYAPDDDLGGVSPVGVALRAVGVTLNISAFSEYFFKNGAMPDLILVSQNRLMEADRERIQAEWQRRFGGLRKAHGTAVLEAGSFDVKVLTPPLKDLAMVELREEERRDICAAMGVPMSIAQAADPALYAAKQDYANFHTLTVLPELDQILDTVNNRLAPWFGDAIVRPDLSQVEALQEDLLEITQRNQIGLAAGYLSINEAREREGLNKLPFDAFVVAGRIIPRDLLEQGRWEELNPTPAIPQLFTQSASPRTIDLVVRNVGPDRSLAVVSSALRDRALEDLQRWRKKAVKKGLEVGFESEYIPVSVALWLRSDLLSWDGETDRAQWIDSCFERAVKLIEGDENELADFDEFWRDLGESFSAMIELFDGYSDTVRDRIVAALSSSPPTEVERILQETLQQAEEEFTNQLLGMEDELGPLLKIFLAGAERGKEILDQSASAAPPIANKATFRIDWQLMHRLARDWARRFTADLVRGINETTLGVFRNAISDWIERGGKLEDLAKYIEGKLPELDIPEGWSPGKLKWAVSRERARLIAQTETTRAYAQGSINLWEQAGVTQAKWRTNNDELVCPICGALNNVVGNVKEGWRHPKTNKVYQVPAHPGCRCFLSPVVALE